MSIVSVCGARTEVPPTPREFRGLWVASVSNIDWPSSRGLSTEQTQAELLSLLDRAAAARINAVILQVRPAADALYASSLEPWSEYLTGEMGRPPSPYWDPLQFAVTEAHRRGIELHAWVNPFRARHAEAKGPASDNHVSRKQPGIVVRYGRWLWLDPGQSAARRHSLAVLLDIVRRYDVDGLHLDDYFYPYKERGRNGELLDFPDAGSYAAYRKSGGRLAKGDWRRKNINDFLKALYAEVKKTKPWVKVGISPFGIWRPGHPESVDGFDPYLGLYADSRLWLREGWLDYFTPQLYWKTDAPKQPFVPLLKWWESQNVRRRHLWPGLNAGNGPAEITAQIQATRRIVRDDGVVLWHSRSVLGRSVADTLASTVFDQDALIPACTWLSDRLPGPPRLTIAENGSEGYRATWEAPRGGAASLWVLKIRAEGRWTVQTLPRDVTSQTLPPEWEAVAVHVVDRYGNESPPAVREAAGGSDTRRT
jgi:uncharacterized lipoprotein YddW (UPF0748 family)